MAWNTVVLTGTKHPDQDLVRRHEREIFPLLRRRRLFAEVEHFFLYDFFTPEGRVNEDVFAYSNRLGDERALVVYHNKYATAHGWIRTSVGYAGKTGRGDERVLMHKDLGTGLGFHPGTDHFYIFRDHITGLEYIRSSKELFDKGLYVELSAYKVHVFLDFREVVDSEWRRYAHLAAYLDGKGVPSIEEALRELFLQPIHQPIMELVNGPLFRKLFDARQTKPQGQLDQAVLNGVEEKVRRMLQAVKQFTDAPGDVLPLTQHMRRKFETALQLPILPDLALPASSPEQREAFTYLQSNISEDLFLWGSLFGWISVHALGRLISVEQSVQQSRTWLDEWLLGRILADGLQKLGIDDQSAWRAVTLIKLLTTHQRWFAEQTPDMKRSYQVLERLFAR